KNICTTRERNTSLNNEYTICSAQSYTRERCVTLLIFITLFMTQVKLVKFKIKEGQKQLWLDWYKELQPRKDEVLETLKNETVVSESCFLSEEGDYVYYFVEAEDMETAQAAFKKSAFTIDPEHREKRMASLEKVGQLEELFHFENRG
ncbi:MAG: DUF6176 family protein, partial [bacterium]|nr:DUF6176 family protein [bacterium]